MSMAMQLLLDVRRVAMAIVSLLVEVLKQNNSNMAQPVFAMATAVHLLR
jgi:hypothetical protein